MKILVPPSEGKAKVKPTKTIFSTTKFRFEREVNQVVRLLELIDDEDLRSVYGTSPEKAMGFHLQNQDIFNSPCAPAIERYTGVVYEHIDWKTLSEKAKNFMEKHVFIFSGLFGLLTPKTPIPDYKLKMNVLSLQHHWNPILSDVLHEEEVIIDLLPQVHRKAYTPNKKNVIQVDFLIINKGKKSAAGHFGKAVKGEFIRYMAENNITKVDEFGGFEFDGFKWDGSSFVKEES
ncbi:MAG: YaaA family protein [Candidatus Marinimicrobia bacterium]|jgi:hypothetical protein|nr:YaaA family protein [Candidatus Neomarinimicrobiota bacterium]MDP6852724.1 YaaA family protein [Candidatus Neomarinimicrobiota bacterium]MDP6935864.1 YaaA family protein [Candidatus Neomarinimicrobiota bacterium]